MYAAVNKRILALSIFCSCLAHAGMLLGLAGRAENPPYPAGQPLSVTLLTETPRIAAVNASATPRKPAPTPENSDAGRAAVYEIQPADDAPLQASAKSLRHQSPADVALMTSRETTDTTRTGKSPGMPETVTPAPPDTPDTVTPAVTSVQTQLHTMMATYFSYPLLARQRNWQGEVRLGLRVEANGRLSHIHIVKSSGYTILDRAAKRSLEQIAAIPEAGNWLHDRHFDMVIPVEYRLIDS